MKKETTTVIVSGPSSSAVEQAESDVTFEFVSSAAEIVERLLTERPRLIVLLHSPPRFEGIETARAVRNLELEIPILLVLPHRDSFTRASGYQNGVTWCIELGAEGKGSNTWQGVLTNVREYYSGNERKNRSLTN